MRFEIDRYGKEIFGLLGAALICAVTVLAQNGSTPTWPEPVPNRQAIAAKDKKPAPRRSLVGMWGSMPGNRQATNQSSGVQLKPNNGRPENQLPYTPHGLELYKSHKPLEGVDAVPPAATNDPRVRCEPLGLPRHNHYDLGIQIFQDEYKVAMLYQYDNQWRIIWTDGRPLPKLADGGGVEINGQYREPRWFGYSVGTWVDDYTLDVQTVGTMPEQRVWLDNTGRPISDQLRIRETFRRLDYDTLEWSETIEDPKVYTRPWQTMKLPMMLQDPRTDLMTRYCSPTEVDAYNKAYGDAVSGK
jgi:hypothetical protein